MRIAAVRHGAEGAGRAPHSAAQAHAGHGPIGYAVHCIRPPRGSALCGTVLKGRVALGTRQRERALIGAVSFGSRFAAVRGVVKR